MKVTQLELVQDLENPKNNYNFGADVPHDRKSLKLAFKAKGPQRLKTKEMFTFDFGEPGFKRRVGVNSELRLEVVYPPNGKRITEEYMNGCDDETKQAAINLGPWKYSRINGKCLSIKDSHGNEMRTSVTNKAFQCNTGNKGLKR